MNTPNKLTLLRIILVPVFVAFLLLSQIPNNFLYALIVFILASATDALDGHLARKNNMVTTFGKFLDPLADKVLVISGLICFVELKLISAVVVIIIIAREFLVTSLRLVAVDGGNVIAASSLGKLKTAFTMIAIIFILALGAVKQWGIGGIGTSLDIVGEILIWIAAILTLISGIEYLVVNRKCINVTK
ncbi:MAG: pgsA [Oscillospiraceae bacterium]|jgi:CDP-diacylglycerol--glycerol-3-phosphate 3-phosphatidyltransferase|nr:pgsA [Oscillospiraceae bacterium]